MISLRAPTRKSIIPVALESGERSPMPALEFKFCWVGNMWVVPSLS
jgi:hypothetical protein